MIVVMKKSATEEEVNLVASRITELNFEPHVDRGETTIVGVRGDTASLRDRTGLLMLPGVENVVVITKPFKEVSKEFHPSNTIVEVDRVKIGLERKIIIAGPCSVESEYQLMKSAEGVKEAGVDILRGGSFKSRTSPYSFQGLGKDGLDLLVKAREKFGLSIVTEILNPDHLQLFLDYDIDLLQVGARNSKNYDLLNVLGSIKKPILLKRGEASTIEEFLLAAEYLLANGNGNVILCERGIRTFERYTRYTLDLSAVPLIKELSHLPIFVDPSHGTGKRSLVAPMSKAALSAGADGLIIEVHYDPSKAKSDSEQQLGLEEFKDLMRELRTNYVLSSSN